jgi:pyruvate/2-oxoglutarate dehydrogenase complex dihydrolipoamide dehydrogenase (E3) component
MSASLLDVAVIGAGPNGLGLATHLRQAGLDYRVFGSPMETWRAMPDGMYLKSLGFATTIPTPGGHPTFPEYCRANGLEDYEPIEFATFARYGMTLQRWSVPELEDVKVVELVRAGSAFVLTLETGERVAAKRVVVAVGLTYFAQLPEVLRHLPPDRLAHTWGTKDYSSFSDREVVVIGGGSSALEAATLLHEHGAHVRVLARGDVHFGGRSPREHERSLIERVKLPISSLGHGRENWVLQHLPGLMYHVPSRKRLPFTRRHLGPAPAWWLRPRADGTFSLHRHTHVVNASMAADRVRLQVVGPEERDTVIEADHVIAGTGYEFDVDRISFIDRVLLTDLRRHELAPRLDRHFQSSVPGLYFIGPVAAESFGPLVRFVAGAPFAVSRVSSHLLHRAARRSFSARRPAVVSRPATARAGMGA